MLSSYTSPGLDSSLFVSSGRKTETETVAVWCAVTQFSDSDWLTESRRMYEKLREVGFSFSVSDGEVEYTATDRFAPKTTVL